MNNRNICRNSHNCRVFFSKMLIVLAIILVVFPMIQLTAPRRINAVTLEELKNEVGKLSAEEENLVEEIINTENLIVFLKCEIETLDEKIIVLESEVKELYEEIFDLQDSMDKKKELLIKRIVYTYKYGNDNIARLIISAGDINEVVNSIYLFRNIMRRDAELIEEIRYEKEEYDRILRKSEEKKKEIKILVKEKENEKQKLQVTLVKEEQLLEQVKQEKQEVQDYLSAIRRRIAEIQPSGVALVGEWKMIATAYYSGGGGINGNGITAMGLRARKGIIAVDPRVIPLGTRVFIDGYGVATAGDTGGWIKGNRVDLCFESLEQCFRYGRRTIYVYLVN